MVKIKREGSFMLDMFFIYVFISNVVYFFGLFFLSDLLPLHLVDIGVAMFMPISVFFSGLYWVGHIYFPKKWFIVTLILNAPQVMFLTAILLSYLSSLTICRDFSTCKDSPFLDFVLEFLVAPTEALLDI